MIKIILSSILLLNFQSFASEKNITPISDLKKEIDSIENLTHSREFKYIENYEKRIINYKFKKINQVLKKSPATACADGDSLDRIESFKEIRSFAQDYQNGLQKSATDAIYFARDWLAKYPCEASTQYIKNVKLDVRFKNRKD